MTLYYEEAMDYQPSKNFEDCYAVVKEHLLLKSDNALVWQKSWPRPPFLEHLSFHLGNQKFFVAIADIDEELDVPPNTDGFVQAARLFNGIPCCIWTRKVNGKWTVIGDDWALYAPEGDEWPVTGKFNPTDLLTDIKIPLNRAEIHYSAVRGLMSAYSEQFKGSKFNPQYDPDLWPSFIMQRPGNSYDEAFLVFAHHYPEMGARDDDSKNKVEEIQSRLLSNGMKSYILDVQVIAEGQDVKDNENIIPICRCEHYLTAVPKMRDL